MFTLSFERTRRVLKVTLIGVLSSEDLVAAESAIVSFTSREGPSRRLVDFTRVEAIALPATKLIRRGSQSPTSPGWDRVFVASRPDLLALVRDFSQQQSLSGIQPPHVVTSMDEAFEALELVDPRFDALDGEQG
jgi:hypothetical protein